MADQTSLFQPPPGADDPLGMLVACHRRLEARLEGLVEVATVLADAPGTRLEAATSALARAISQLDVAEPRHVEDEEASLFPRWRAADAGADAVIAALEADHHAIEDGWRALRPTAVALRDALAAGTAPDPALVAELRARAPGLAEAHRAHHAREEAEVLPRAAAALDAAALGAIGAEMAARRGGTGD